MDESSSPSALSKVQLERKCTDHFWELIRDTLALDFHDYTGTLKANKMGKDSASQHLLEKMLPQHFPLFEKIRVGETPSGWIEDKGRCCGAIQLFRDDYRMLVTAKIDRLTRENNERKFPSPKSIIHETALKEVAKSCTVKHLISFFKKIDFSNRNIFSLDRRFKALFNNLSNLRELSVSQNKLEDLHNIPESLHILNVTQNRITSVQDLKELTRLQHIGLGYNLLDNVNFLKQSCSALISIDLSFNMLTDLTGVVNVLSRVPQLQVVALVGNVITFNPVYRQLVIRECKKLMVLDDINVTDEERQFIAMNELSLKSIPTIDITIRISRLKEVRIVPPENPDNEIVEENAPKKKATPKTTPRSVGKATKGTNVVTEEPYEPKYSQKTEYYVQLRVPKEVLRVVEDETNNGDEFQGRDGVKAEEDVIFKTEEMEAASSIDFDFSVTLYKLYLTEGLRDFLVRPLELMLMKKTVDVLVIEEEAVKTKAAAKRQKSRPKSVVSEEPKQLPPPLKEINVREERIGNCYYDLLDLFDYMTTKVESETSVRNFMSYIEEPTNMTLSASVQINSNVLYQQIHRNRLVTEQNSEIVVETLRSIAEMMIWGDQNNPSFWDFFLEKNMLSYFLVILQQNCSSHVKKQLIQTLSIFIQNVENKDSFYFLMSNNHIDKIITHAFDFENEEILAYYITFLKTISLKLDLNIIQFFFDDYHQTFPLYTESIKFFNFKESMIRIAVRTITLNIFSVNDPKMRAFVLNHSADTYFIDLPWFVREQFLKLDRAAHRCGAGKASLYSLEDCVAEQLDHFYYLNDILKINGINEAMREKLCTILLYPFLVKSILEPETEVDFEETTANVSTNMGSEGTFPTENMTAEEGEDLSEGVFFGSHPSAASIDSNASLQSNKANEEDEETQSESVTTTPMNNIDNAANDTTTSNVRTNSLRSTEDTSQEDNISKSLPAVLTLDKNADDTSLQYFTPPASPSSTSQSKEKRRVLTSKRADPQKASQKKPRHRYPSEDFSTANKTPRIKTIDEIRIPVTRLFFVYGHKELLLELGRMLILPSKDVAAPNPYRETIFSAILSDDEAMVSNAVTFLFGVITNSEATKELLSEIGLEPRRIRKTHRLLDALTNMGNSSKKTTSKQHSDLTSSVESPAIWWRDAAGEISSSNNVKRALDSGSSLNRTKSSTLQADGPIGNEESVKVVLVVKEESKKIIVELSSKIPHKVRDAPPRSLFSSTENEPTTSVNGNIPSDVSDDAVNGDYAFELVGILLDLLQTRPPHRIFTLHMVMRLLLELLSPSRDDPPLLHDSHVKMLAASMSQSVSKIREQWSEMDAMEFYNVWQNEYEQFQRLNAVKPDVFMADASQLLSSYWMNEQLIDEIDYYRRKPNTDKERLQVNLHAVILLHHIYHLLQQRDHPDILAKILAICPTHDEGAEIPMQGQDVIRCNIIEPRQNGVLVSVERFLFFHEKDAHLYVVSRSLNKTGHAIVNCAFPVFYTHTEENLENRYTLQLVAERKNINGRSTKLFDEALVFGNHVKCNEVKTVIDAKIAEAVEKKRKQMEKVLEVER